MLNPTLPVERERVPPQHFLLVGDSLSSNTDFSYKMIQGFTDFKKNCAAGKTDYKAVSAFALPSASPRHFAAPSGSNKAWLCRQKKIYRGGTADDLSGATFCKDIQNLSPFEKLVDEEQPTDIVIALGTNSLAFNSDFVVAQVTDLLEQLPEFSRCFWVAPTFVSRKYQSQVKKVELAIQEALDTSAVSCKMISTFEAMKNQTQCQNFNGSDGIHHTHCGSQLWAEKVFDDICSLY